MMLDVKVSGSITSRTVPQIREQIPYHARLGVASLSASRPCARPIAGSAATITGLARLHRQELLFRASHADGHLHRLEADSATAICRVARTRPTAVNWVNGFISIDGLVNIQRFEVGLLDEA